MLIQQNINREVDMRREEKREEKHEKVKKKEDSKFIEKSPGDYKSRYNQKPSAVVEDFYNPTYKSRYK
jgi:hypothetical protein